LPSLRELQRSRGLRLPAALQGVDIDRLVKLLDDKYRVPGTNIRFGWDAIIGLVPGVGDLATTGLALVPVAVAWKSGASRWLLIRMLANVGIDATLGAIPLVGDVFDVFFKANRRNARLMKEFFDQVDN
jgi:hypothetical protein